MNFRTMKPDPKEYIMYRFTYNSLVKQNYKEGGWKATSGCQRQEVEGLTTKNNSRVSWGMEQFYVMLVVVDIHSLHLSKPKGLPIQRVKFTICEFLENGETQNGIKTVTNDCNCIKSE